MFLGSVSINNIKMSYEPDNRTETAIIFLNRRIRFEVTKIGLKPTVIVKLKGFSEGSSSRTEFVRSPSIHPPPSPEEEPASSSPVQRLAVSSPSSVYRIG